ncbi:hypothetical protein B5P46_18910 [Rhizobium leguminosarum]|uniref:Uncharacterized protein n=1 Tax=Rhizobium leguminosarum TaxID=384 RepID=A0A4Q1U078_RHILE|nr:hypothetical protein B5P46_18910 [Rhizobium leguminosarum]
MTEGRLGEFISGEMEATFLRGSASSMADAGINMRTQARGEAITASAGKRVGFSAGSVEIRQRSGLHLAPDRR